MAIANIHVKVSSEIKAETEEVLGKIGITMSDLFNMTMRRVIIERRLPFDTTVPEVEIPKKMSVDSESEWKKLINERLKKDDLEEIRDYITNVLEDSVASIRILRGIIEKCKELKTFPNGYATRFCLEKKNIRFVHYKNYTVVYYVDDKKVEVNVIAIKYSRMDIENELSATTPRS